METIPEFLKSNDHHLKFCILYEVAQKKPIFDSYRTFCDTVGSDAMEYPDFEFWYYRFSSGELDFDYDRSKDPAPKALMDMPVKLVRKIAENLNPFERSPLRSTNHDIKELSDSLPPFFEEIEIYTSTEKMEWHLDDMQFKCKNNYDESCSFSKPKTYEENYIKKSLEYLTPVFKMPNLRVNSLSLENMSPEREHPFIQLEETPDLDGLLPDVPFHVKEVFFSGYGMNTVIRFLSAMKPGHLETIRLSDNRLNFARENFDAIFETDQFKQANEVSIHSSVQFSVEDLVNFSHLKSFTCRLQAIEEPEKILRILHIVSSFEEFESCRVLIFTDYSIENQYIEKLAEAIGPEGQLDRFKFVFQRPDSNEHLEFEITELSGGRLIEIRKIR
ncbi:unnamed protein product [Caenorhabditis nigoni]